MYTKGEWEVIGHKGEYSIIDTTEQITIADVYGNDKANAQLIAVAPDMYETLKGVATVIHNAIRYEEGGYREMLQRKLKVINEVLAKAEGGK